MLTYAYPPPGTFDDELPTPPLPIDVPFDPPKEVLNCGADIASEKEIIEKEIFLLILRVG